MAILSCVFVISMAITSFGAPSIQGAGAKTIGLFGALDKGHAMIAPLGAETTGLPEKVVASIKSINEGKSISEATGLKEFAEYKRVYGEHLTEDDFIKKWNRDKKFVLIKSINPELRDLSEDW